MKEGGKIFIGLLYLEKRELGDIESIKCEDNKVLITKSNRVTY